MKFRKVQLLHIRLTTLTFPRAIMRFWGWMAYPNRLGLPAKAAWNSQSLRQAGSGQGLGRPINLLDDCISQMVPAGAALHFNAI